MRIPTRLSETTGNKVCDLYQDISQSTGISFPNVATYEMEYMDLHYEVKCYSV
jgi:hypothetical protein